MPRRAIDWIDYPAACQHIYGHLAGLDEAIAFYQMVESGQIVMTKGTFGHAFYRKSDVEQVAKMRRVIVPAK